MWYYWPNDSFCQPLTILYNPFINSLRVLYFLLYHQIIQVHGTESWIWQHLITVWYDPIWSEFLRFWEIKRYLYVFYSINLYFLLNSTIYIFNFLKFKSLPPQIQCVLSQNHCFHSQSCNPLRRNLSFCYKSLNIPIFLRF